jgi:hypothetical protein
MDAGQLLPFLDLGRDLGLFLQDRRQQVGFVPGTGSGELFFDFGQAFLVSAQVKDASRIRESVRPADCPWSSIRNIAA